MNHTKSRHERRLFDTGFDYGCMLIYILRLQALSPIHKNNILFMMRKLPNPCSYLSIREKDCQYSFSFFLTASFTEVYTKSPSAVKRGFIAERKVFPGRHQGDRPCLARYLSKYNYQEEAR